MAGSPWICRLSPAGYGGFGRPPAQPDYLNPAQAALFWKCCAAGAERRCGGQEAGGFRTALFDAASALPPVALEKAARGLTFTENALY